MTYCPAGCVCDRGCVNGICLLRDLAIQVVHAQMQNELRECRNCMYYYASLSECRRHAPKASIYDCSPVQPVVLENYGCGDFVRSPVSTIDLREPSGNVVSMELK
jgi:hypothetical protein